MAARFSRCFRAPWRETHVLLSRHQKCWTLSQIINKKWSCRPSERRHLHPDEATFTTASALFLRQWRKKKNICINDFLSYFEKEWLLKYRNWFAGAAPGHPSSNNGLEATNAVIKKENTLRERLPVGQFLNCMSEIVKMWSRSRDPLSVNCVVFAESPTLSLKLWTDAFNWAVSNRPMLQHDKNDCTKFFVWSSRMEGPITPQMLRKFQRCEGRWTDFNDLKSWLTEIWVITSTPAGVECT